MKKTVMLVGLSVPLLLGGLVFAGGNRPVAPAAPPVPPVAAAPAAPAAPKAPKAPKDPWSASGGTNTNFNVHIDGLDSIKDNVRDALAQARASIADDKSLPPEVRAAALARMDKVKAVLDSRLTKLNLADLANLDKQLSGLDTELAKALDGVDDEFEKLADKYGKQFAKDFDVKWSKDFKHWQGKFRMGKVNSNFSITADDDDDDDDGAQDQADAARDQAEAAREQAEAAREQAEAAREQAEAMSNDDDDIDTVDMSAAADLDGDDLNDAVDDITDMGIDAKQRTQLSALRHEEQATSNAARERMRQASSSLRAELAKPAADIAVVNRLIDQISVEEANVRKAQLKALVSAKAMLTAAQQKKVQDAAKKAKGK
jgi:Spy/CpxP family protein refolding chaperone